MKLITKTTLFLLLVSFLSFSYGQETLQQKYDLVVEGAETYQQFKVVARSDLTSFWAEVTDTLKTKNATIKNLTEKVENAENEKNALLVEIEGVEEQLETSLGQKDSIGFLGIDFSKTGYHFLVWTIIFVLLALIVILYLMFVRSNKVTVRVKKDYSDLSAEYANHKDNARAAQIKLKRELQTALNQLNERRS